MKRIIATICALLGFAASSRATSEIEVKLKLYLQLAREERWAEALPVIEEIVRADSAVWTSWFNRGVCLDGLGRHRDAARSFQKAYGLQPDNYGAQYRVFRSLALAKDYDEFARFLSEEGKRVPEVFEILKEDPEFSAALSAPPVLDVYAKQKKG